MRRLSATKSFFSSLLVKARIVHVERPKTKLAVLQSRLARPPLPATVPAAPTLPKRCGSKSIAHRRRHPARGSRRLPSFCPGTWDHYSSDWSSGYRAAVLFGCSGIRSDRDQSTAIYKTELLCTAPGWTKWRFLLYLGGSLPVTCGRIVQKFFRAKREGTFKEKPDDRGKLQMSAMRRGIDEANTRYHGAYATSDQNRLTRSLYPMWARGRCPGWNQGSILKSDAVAKSTQTHLSQS